MERPTDQYFFQNGGSQHRAINRGMGCVTGTISLWRLLVSILVKLARAHATIGIFHSMSITIKSL